MYKKVIVLGLLASIVTVEAQTVSKDMAARGGLQWLDRGQRLRPSGAQWRGAKLLWHLLQVWGAGFH